MRVHHADKVNDAGLQDVLNGPRKESKESWMQRLRTGSIAEPATASSSIDNTAHERQASVVPKASITGPKDYSTTKPGDERISRSPQARIEFSHNGSSTESPSDSESMSYQLLGGMTFADSGYSSGGFPTERNTTCEQTIVDDDCASIATDGLPSALPGSDKYLLESQFARALFNRLNIRAREQLVMNEEKVGDLIQCFAVMIGRRASSSIEKIGASFVRRRRM